jgi:hypothetical protein
MHILIVNFTLEGIGEEEYRNMVEPIAPAFATLAGLVSKTWLADEKTNTYGGVRAGFRPAYVRENFAPA